MADISPFDPDVIHRGNQLARAFCAAWIDPDTELKARVERSVLDEAFADRDLAWATLAGFSQLATVLLGRLERLTGESPHEVLARIAQHWEQ